MAVESIPIKIYFELTDTIDGNLPLPRFTMKFNGNTIGNDLEMDKPCDVTWQTDKKVSVHEFFVDIDDDEENEHSIEIIKSYDNAEVWDLLKDDPESGGKEDYGFFIKDIEINDISIESLVNTHGTVKATICDEDGYDTNGFISYLKSMNQIHEISTVNGKCIWTTTTNFVNVDTATFTFNFKTPLYLWLLEILLQ